MRGMRYWMLFFRKIKHYLLVLIIAIERLLRRQRIKTVNKEALDAVRNIRGPIIFAPTHCGKFDIQVLTEVLWKYEWSLLSGDYDQLPGTIEGFWLKFNGVIYVNRDDKEWRNRAKREMIAHLKKGGNIMMYPEGTWNLSPNLPVLPLFRGVADVAIETKAAVIPFAQEIDDSTNTYYVKVGNPIFTDADTEPLALLEKIRMQMAEMKWSLIEELPFCRMEYDREALQTAWDAYIEKRVSECAYYDYELSWKYARREQWQIEREQIRIDIAAINPTMKNLFLFSKRTGGQP